MFLYLLLGLWMFIPLTRYIFKLIRVLFKGIIYYGIYRGIKYILLERRVY